MNREEMLAWAKSLNPGDKVIYVICGKISVETVVKVTPAGWVKITTGSVYSQNSWSYYFMQRGGIGHIEPVTDELLQKAKEQAEKRAEEGRQRKVIEKAQNFVREESDNRWKMSYERAVKIVAAFEQING